MGKVGGMGRMGGMGKGQKSEVRGQRSGVGEGKRADHLEGGRLEEWEKCEGCEGWVSRWGGELVGRGEWLFGSM